MWFSNLNHGFCWCLKLVFLCRAYLICCAWQRYANTSNRLSRPTQHAHKARSYYLFLLVADDSNNRSPFYKIIKANLNIIKEIVINDFDALHNRNLRSNVTIIHNFVVGKQFESQSSSMNIIHRAKWLNSIAIQYLVIGDAQNTKQSVAESIPKICS